MENQNNITHPKYVKPLTGILFGTGTGISIGSLVVIITTAMLQSNSKYYEKQMTRGAIGLVVGIGLVLSATAVDKKNELQPVMNLKEKQ